MKRPFQLILHFVLLIFLSSCQSAKDTIKDVEVIPVPPKIEKPDSVIIKVCCK